jgi:predicted transcriptional regulator
MKTNQTYTMCVRLTPEFKGQIDEAAEREQMATASFIRRALARAVHETQTQYNCKAKTP